MESYDNLDCFEFERAAPHFCDARVLRHARRVVPLAETNRNKNKSRLFLTGAFAAAMLLGAAVALLAARLERQRFQAAAALEISKVETTNSSSLAAAPKTEKSEEMSQPAASPEAAVPLAATQAIINDNQPTPDAPESASKAASKPATRPVHLPVAEPQHQDESLANDSVDPINDLPNDDKAAQPPAIVDEWQERRLRRIEKLDRRARRSQQGRDLMRIDEIFEGSRRP